MRILADENVHVDIIHRLRDNNYEVFSVQDVGLAGHKDREILDYQKNTI